MVDDEKLQELLAQASSLYNNGDYKGAIGAWQEALSVDPSNQKAKEGVRMATLLLGDWDPAGQGTVAEAPGDPLEPADGGAQTGDIAPEEAEARLDLGIARVKQLIAERKYPEAIEGAKGLLPLAPESEEIHRLLEEAQHAFESAPFVEEHLTLARELMAQERYSEAEAECKKVFVLDASHPGARTLLARIREKVQGNLTRAARSLGGMTVKLSAGEVLEAARAAKPAVPAGPTAGMQRDEAGEFVMDEADPPASPQEHAGVAQDGEAAATQEEVSARNRLEDAFREIVSEGDGDAGAAPAEAPEAAAAGPEEIQAATVVPPSVRPSPRTGPAKTKAADPATAGPAAAGAPGEEAPFQPSGQDETTAWETELTQLNIKAEERDLLRGTAAKIDKTPSGAAADPDLLSLLDNDIGMAGMAAAAAPADPAAHHAKTPVAKKPRAATTKIAPPAETVAAAPQESIEAPPRERPGKPPLPPPHRGSFLPKFLVLILLLAAGAAAGWWFLLRPRAASGAALPGQPASPPSASSTSAAPAGAGGVIPTPIGAGARQSSRQEPAPSDDAMADTGVPVQGGHPAGTDPAAAPRRAPAEPIKPVTPRPLTPEEVHHKVATYGADGRRLLAQGKWREARAKFLAVLALDPANLDIKDLADQAQARIDEENRLLEDFESAKKFFSDKDYENALRKFYRLPRDKNLGDLDLYVRNAWFNWAVVSMKAGNASDALNKLAEVLEADPDDAEALKLQEVAERYTSRAKDRVYYAFTDTLRLRTFDQK